MVLDPPLRFPNATISFLQVLAAYSASVALNGILPAGLGTSILLVMFTSIITGATFSGILGAYAVEKIFYTVIGAFVYLYLFLTVTGSFDTKFSWVKDHPWTTGVLLIGGAFLLFLLVRRFWPRVVKWWDEAKSGGQILTHPKAYFGRVFLPELVSWVCMLCVNAIFLAAYSIPVTFHTLMSIVGGNSLASVTSVTPGGVGVNQAFNVASLRNVASSETATAFSVGHQLVMTAWSILMGIVLMAWAFGWAGGKGLVGESYTEAKTKAAEQKAAHRARKEAKKEAKREAKLAAKAGRPGTTGQSSG